MPELTPHQERLLADFLGRARGMSVVNLGAGIAACAGAMLLDAPQWLVALLGTLGGARQVRQGLRRDRQRPESAKQRCEGEARETW